MMHLLQIFGDACKGGDFLGFPTWYKYLDGVTAPDTKVCSPIIGSLNDVWLIVAAIIEILLRIAAVAAVAYVIYGGISYMLSQGEPDKTQQARHTITNALVGLVIAITAATTIQFIAGRIH